MIYQWIENTFGTAQNKIIGIEGLAVALLCFIVSAIVLKIIIPILRKHKVGQHVHGVLENHASKEGTPTMGGVGFIIGILIVCLVWVCLEVFGIMGNTDKNALVVFAYTLLLGVLSAIIGLVDDRAKLRRKQNEGLTSKQKMFLQIVVATAYVAVMAISGNLSTGFVIPFTSFSLELSYAAYPLYVLVIVGFVNSTNITDGLDGLASSVGVSVAGTLLLVSCILSERYMGVLSGALLGGLLAFLLYNHYPAKVFMGDTGSLFIGGIVVGCAVVSGNFISVMIMGMVFILDMLSSLLQTTYYKLTKKRIFKRAPVHHHFEMLGWKETKIVTVFFITSCLFCAVGVLGIIFG